MKKFIILCITCVTLFISCKKEVSLPYTFIGKVTDVNGNPISGANVNLSAYYRGNVLSGGGYYQKAQAKTDNMGRFSASFNVDSTAKNFMIHVFANNYFPYYNENIFQSNIQNKVLTVNPVVYKLSTIKITFKNASPVSATDNFSVFQTNELFGPSFNTFIERQYTGGTFNELEHRYIGNNIQGYELTKTKGDTYTVINWTSKKNGVINYVIDRIFTAGGTQGTYNINY